MNSKNRILFVLLALLSAFVSGVYLSHASKVDKSEDRTGQGMIPQPTVILLTINGTINPATTDYIRDGIALAVDSGAEGLIIEMDTPGGLLNSTKDIVKLILNSPVPVVVYVSPSGSSATSAGVFITLSAHIAAMADGTSIGAAHPVTLGGGGGKSPIPGQKTPEQKKEEKDAETGKKSRSQEDIMGEKIENFASSFIESIAEKRNRNTKWASEAVRKSASITSSEALEIKVIDLVSPNLDDLVNSINGWKVSLPDGEKVLATKGAKFERLEMNVKQKMVDILSTPNIAFLLLSLGSLGLTMEIFKPGMIFPGVVGAIFFLTGCVSLQILPFNYAGLALLVLSLALFIAEIFVTSFGLLSLAGVISLVIGGILLFETPESNLRVGFDVLLSVALSLGSFFVFIAYYLFKSQRLPQITGREGLIGMQGNAVTDISGTGKVFVSGDYWDAEAEEHIVKGDKVMVLEMGEQMRLKVKKS